MDLEIIILSEDRPRKTDTYDAAYMWDLQYDTNELIHKTEIEWTDGYRRGRVGEGGLGAWGGHGHTAVFKADNQQGPTV